MQKWKVDQRIYDLHVGARHDVVDSQLTVNGVVFHVPFLKNDNLYVLWKCLWPDCHNCCERQGRLPLTKDDIGRISAKLDYKSESEFIRKETTVSHWDEQQYGGGLITTLSMISLKRSQDEKEQDDGKPIQCRFLDKSGSCSIHPDKPGVCWLYPFSSWLEVDTLGKPVAHAAFQFTGDCPGFYLDSSIDSATPMMQEYSHKIFNYNMAISRTTRENYGFINFVKSEPMS